MAVAGPPHPGVCDLAGQLTRLLTRVIWSVICHPLLDLVAGLIVLDYLNLGWPGLATTGGLILAVCSACG